MPPMSRLERKRLQIESELFTSEQIANTPGLICARFESTVLDSVDKIPPLPAPQTERSVFKKWAGRTMWIHERDPDTYFLSARTLGDGNCYWRAVALIVYGVENVWPWVKAQHRLWVQQVLADKNHARYVMYDKYAKDGISNRTNMHRLLTPGEWTLNDTGQITADLYDICLMVFDCDPFMVGSDSRNARATHIYGNWNAPHRFLRFMNNNHWEACRPLVPRVSEYRFPIIKKSEARDWPTPNATMPGRGYFCEPGQVMVPEQLFPRPVIPVPTREDLRLALGVREITQQPDPQPNSGSTVPSTTAPFNPQANSASDGPSMTAPPNPQANSGSAGHSMAAPPNPQANDGGAGPLMAVHPYHDNPHYKPNMSRGDRMKEYLKATKSELLSRCAKLGLDKFTWRHTKESMIRGILGVEDSIKNVPGASSGLVSRQPETAITTTQQFQAPVQAPRHTPSALPRLETPAGTNLPYRHESPTIADHPMPFSRRSPAEQAAWDKYSTWGLIRLKDEVKRRNLTFSPHRPKMSSIKALIEADKINNNLPVVNATPPSTSTAAHSSPPSTATPTSGAQPASLPVARLPSDRQPRAGVLCPRNIHPQLFPSPPTEVQAETLTVLAQRKGMKADLSREDFEPLQTAYYACFSAAQLAAEVGARTTAGGADKARDLVLNDLDLHERVRRLPCDPRKRKYAGVEDAWPWPGSPSLHAYDGEVFGFAPTQCQEDTFRTLATTGQTAAEYLAARTAYYGGFQDVHLDLELRARRMRFVVAQKEEALARDDLKRFEIVKRREEARRSEEERDEVVTVVSVDGVRWGRWDPNAPRVEPYKEDFYYSDDEPVPEPVVVERQATRVRSKRMKTI